MTRMMRLDEPPHGSGVKTESGRCPSANRGASILEVVEANDIGTLRRYEKGHVLHWQGDPAERAHVVKEGTIEVLSTSPEGAVLTYDIFGPGVLVDSIALLSGEDHRWTAKARGEGAGYVIPRDEFQHLLNTNASFCMSVMVQVAWIADFLARQVWELHFLSVQQRLESSLRRLADRHGVLSEEGFKIDLDLTHKEIGRLIGAHRSTVTSYLGELEREGFVRREDHRFVLLPPECAQIFRNLKRSVIECDCQAAANWARQVVRKKADPFRALDALTAGIRQVGDAFARGEVALPDLVGASSAMKSATQFLAEAIKKRERKAGALGSVVIGTVHGDIHDIGKGIVSTILTAEGFEVTDLGVNVTAEQFTTAVWRRRPDILAMSALMTTAAMEQGKVIQTLKDEGLREKVKIMIGGGAITRELAQSMGADGYEPGAGRAPELAKRLLRAG